MQSPGILKSYESAIVTKIIVVNIVFNQNKKRIKVNLVVPVVVPLYIWNTSSSGKGIGFGNILILYQPVC